MLKKGQIPIYEPGLDALVAKTEKAGRLHFTTELKETVEKSLAIFIAVGTPPKEDGSADLTYVVEVAEAIADHMNGYKVVVTKSTVPIGTGQLIEKVIKESNGKQPFSVVSNPEFLREGSAIGDFMRPDRVVIGARDAQAIAIMKDIYAPLYLIETPFVITNVESSELIKYASNAFLATKITFINEVAELCELLGADVHHVAKGMGLDRRIGPKFLHAGPGYGGSCFPKDTKALSDIARQAGRPFEIVDTVVAVNERVKLRMADKIRKMLRRLGRRPDDRRARRLVQARDRRHAGGRGDPILQALVADGASIRVFDPAATETAREVLPAGVVYCADEFEAARGADCLVVLTEWNQFRSLDLERLRQTLRAARVVDLRNVYEPEKMRAMGFEYDCVGRTAKDLPRP